MGTNVCCVHTKYISSLRHHYHVHDCWREALDSRRENGVSIIKRSTRPFKIQGLFVLLFRVRKTLRFVIRGAYFTRMRKRHDFITLSSVGESKKKTDFIVSDNNDMPSCACFMKIKILTVPRCYTTLTRLPDQCRKPLTNYTYILLYVTGEVGLPN